MNGRLRKALEELLERLLEECRTAARRGRVADYIPESAKGDPEALGVYIIGSEGKRSWAGDREIDVDEAVYRSDKEPWHLAYLLKSHGLLDGDVEEVLDCYFRACSIQVDCRALAHIGAVLSNRGRLPISNERISPASMSRYVNAILMTCGMYDGSGEFALRVGVPAKSGAGGGIMAVVPTRMGIGMFGPALDRKGDSVAGIESLERSSGELHLNIS